MEFYSTNLAADICLTKMVAGLLSHPLNDGFIPPKIICINFAFITKIPGDTLLTKMPAELLSTEQIFTKTSRLVSLTRNVVVNTRTETKMETGCRSVQLPPCVTGIRSIGTSIHRSIDRLFD